jgi:deoxyribodipyrimidine photo-lyase
LSVTDLGLEPSIDWAEGLREAWQPGEAGATDRMRVFAEGAAEQYAVERDRPDHLGTSRLSPHLHFGEISPRQVWHTVQAEPYQRQLIWREFAHHLLFHYPQTSDQPMRPEFGRFPWRMDGPAFRAWAAGQTGYPLVDAGMRELWRTGWMHNRVRMVAASFLVKHLMISWQEGAAWFWDTLVDAGLANNTMGWQWVAGCGADAAPYFRIFNPALQAGKFDPRSDYIRRWIPELTTTYPSPMVDHAAARERALAAFASLKTR